MKEEIILIVEEILEDMEELVRDAWNLPLSGGKGFINIDRISELINEIRDELPNELNQAKAIIADRSQIINDAKEEANNIISSSESKAKVMVEKDEIVRQAKEKSEEILLDAKVNARDIKKAANDYIDDVMKHVDDSLTMAVSDLRKARQNLKTNQ